MSSNKTAATADLDAFLAEVTGEAPVIRLYGRDWELKPEMPALLMLTLRSTLANEDDTLTFEQEVDLLRSLLANPQQVDDLLTAGMGANAFTALIRVALAVYAGADPHLVVQEMVQEARDAREAAETEGTEPGEAEPEGKAPARKTTRTSSSKSGKRSKRT